MKKSVRAVSFGVVIGTAVMASLGCSGFFGTTKPDVQVESPMVSMLRDRESAVAALRADMATARIDAAKKEAELAELREMVAQLRRDLAYSRQTMLDLRQEAESQSAAARTLREERDQLKQARTAHVTTAAPDLQEALVKLTQEMESIKQGLQHNRRGPEHPVKEKVAPVQAPQASAFFVQPEAAAPHSRSPLTVTVQAGDTLWGLAQRYQVAVDTIRRNNRLSGEHLETGRKLVIYPSGTDTP